MWVGRRVSLVKPLGRRSCPYCCWTLPYLRNHHPTVRTPSSMSRPQFLIKSGSNVASLPPTTHFAARNRPWIDSEAVLRDGTPNEPAIARARKQAASNGSRSPRRPKTTTGAATEIATGGGAAAAAAVHRGATARRDGNARRAETGTAAATVIATTPPRRRRPHPPRPLLLLPTAKR